MRVRAYGISAPKNDVTGMYKTFRISPQARASRHPLSRYGAGSAKRFLSDTASQFVEEGIPCMHTVEQPHVARIAIRQYCLSAMLRDNDPPTRRDFIKRLVPAYLIELSTTFRARPSKWV